ncbi:hypothetical protein B0T44_01375 [Nocardia donostiensis]|uniref:Uncharacterized protein n=2 Tax=Nocardia donostiensis TaxID=1538463 RepID=A0A1W0BP70_9NOCA|nr:hypothetical protein B0T46_16665 [Nocardia donostiensis]OQS24288.1 hypothetical protein B0T44_01375 [Nocardia donostiensis]
MDIDGCPGAVAVQRSKAFLMRMSSVLRGLTTRLSTAFRGEAKVVGGDMRKVARVRSSARAVKAASNQGDHTVRKAWLYTGAVALAPAAVAGYVIWQEQGADDLVGSENDQPPVETGLGAEVDELANKSPTLQKTLRELYADGWTIDYDAGAYTMASQKIIGIDSNYKDNPEEVIAQLAHESGHAYDGRFEWDYTPPEPGMSREEWVQQHVFKRYQDEAHSELLSAKVFHEIHQNNGPNIVSGMQQKYPNHSADLYQQIVDGKISWEEARATLARELEADGNRWPKMRESTEKFYDDIFSNWSH